MESNNNDDKVILDVYKKIEREKVIIQGAKSVRQSTSNVSVQQRCDTNIREAQNNITYLEETMRQLKLRKKSTGDSSSGASSNITGSTNATAVTTDDEQQSIIDHYHNDGELDSQRNNYNNNGNFNDYYDNNSNSINNGNGTSNNNRAPSPNKRGGKYCYTLRIRTPVLTMSFIYM